MFGKLQRLAVILLAATLVVGPALASGDSPSPSPTAHTPQPELSYKERTHRHYSRGLYYREKARRLEKQLEMARTDKERDKLGKKIGKTYRMAMGEFEDALRLSPNMIQASCGLGYSLRKSGDYQQSLEAYDHALLIEPSHVDAIEGRAEAYLALGQLEDAKSAYIELIGNDRARSNELLRAMQVWLEQQDLVESEIPQSILEYFAEWVDERAEAAGR